MTLAQDKCIPMLSEYAWDIVGAQSGHLLHGVLGE